MEGGITKEVSLRGERREETLVGPSDRGSVVAHNPQGALGNFPKRSKDDLCATMLQHR